VETGAMRAVDGTGGIAGSTGLPAAMVRQTGQAMMNMLASTSTPPEKRTT